MHKIKTKMGDYVESTFKLKEELLTFYGNRGSVNSY